MAFSPTQPSHEEEQKLQAASIRIISNAADMPSPLETDSDKTAYAKHNAVETTLPLTYEQIVPFFARFKHWFPLATRLIVTWPDSFPDAVTMETTDAIGNQKYYPRHATLETAPGTFMVNGIVFTDRLFSQSVLQITPAKGSAFNSFRGEFTLTPAENTSVFRAKMSFTPIGAEGSQVYQTVTRTVPIMVTQIVGNIRRWITSPNEIAREWALRDQLNSAESEEKMAQESSNLVETVTIPCACTPAQLMQLLGVKNRQAFITEVMQGTQEEVEGDSFTLDNTSWQVEEQTENNTLAMHSQGANNFMVGFAWELSVLARGNDDAQTALLKIVATATLGERFAPENSKMVQEQLRAMIPGVACRYTATTARNLEVASITPTLDETAASNIHENAAPLEPVLTRLGFSLSR